MTTFEYDKSGNVIRQVYVSNINDLGSGGDGSVFETSTVITTYDSKNHPVLQVAELDEDSNGTLESRQTTTYVNDARGNALKTVLSRTREPTARWTFDSPPPRPTTDRGMRSKCGRRRT